MSFKFDRSLLAMLLALVGASASFVLTTVSMDTAPDAVLVGFPSAIAFAISLVVLGRRGLDALIREDRAVLVVGAIAGALAFWAAPLLVLSQRASDAPSGAETLFFTTSMWGLACVLAAYAVRAERPSVVALAGALAAVAGAAGLLACWESPSSFSPFAKFPGRESLMLLAGVMFAMGAVVLSGVARRVGARLTSTVALGGAAVPGLIFAALSLFVTGQSISAAVVPLIYLGFAVAAFVLGWMFSAEKTGLSMTSVALLGAPLGVTALTFVERLTVVYGPNPMTVSGVIAGSVALAAGAVVVWLAGEWIEPQPDTADRRRLRLPLAIALLGLILAVAALFTPALRASATGGMQGGFSATWDMLGFESATGWLVVASAALALAAVLVASRGASIRQWGPAAVAALVCSASAIPLAGITLHTWNRWVPADVQQTYGTEYSSLLVEARLAPVRLVAIALVAVSVVVLAVVAGRRVASRASEQVVPS